MEEWLTALQDLMGTDQGVNRRVPTEVFQEQKNIQDYLPLPTKPLDLGKSMSI